MKKNRFLGQLGSKLEAREAPKSRPRREKIDVKKQCVSKKDFGLAWAWFLKGFGMVFGLENPCNKRRKEKRPRAVLIGKNQCFVDVDTFATKRFSSKAPRKFPFFLEHRFRRYSMCCAQTAAPEGRIKNAGK